MAVRPNHEPSERASIGQDMYVGRVLKSGCQVVYVEVQVALPELTECS